MSLLPLQYILSSFNVSLLNKGVFKKEVNFLLTTNFWTVVYCISIKLSFSPLCLVCVVSSAPPVDLSSPSWPVSHLARPRTVCDPSERSRPLWCHSEGSVPNTMMHTNVVSAQTTNRTILMSDCVYREGTHLTWCLLYESLICQFEGVTQGLYRILTEHFLSDQVNV